MYDGASFAFNILNICTLLIVLTLILLLTTIVVFDMFQLLMKSQYLDIKICKG